jgi:cob(I)alamin adenosyltransferase
MGGDKGKTGLFGGDRVSKASFRLHAYGTVDELNAILGLILSESDVPDVLRTQLHQVQKDLFCLGADLATPIKKRDDRVVRMSEDEVKRLEKWGVEIEEDLPALQRFILPSGCKGAALLHQARTVCRRAERWLVHLAEEDPVNEHAQIYINRLSDYFFLASRSVNKAVGTPETEWLP